MKIHNVRLGLANNSSSTHSLVFFPEGGVEKDCVYGAEFGWDYFTAGDIDSKKDYLAITLYHSLLSTCQPEVAKLVVREWCGVSSNVVEEGYIDHQSLITLPSNWNGKGVDLEFFNDFKEFLLNSKVAILGGNDNDDYDHPLLSEGKRMGAALPTDSRDNTHYVARKDKLTKHWSIFNRNNGAKIRLSFDPSAPSPIRSYAPELVDIKITDYCPFERDCGFCYMGSGKNGKHADTEIVNELLQQIGYCEWREMGWKAFEVAIGGGEPTLHPDFVSILKNARQYGLIPNFTTKNLGWLKKDGLRDEILELCGSFAFSINNTHTLEDLLALTRVYNIPRGKFTIQSILGVVREAELEEIMRVCGDRYIPITLLGYKTTGRGKDFQELTVNSRADEIIERLLEKDQCPTLRVDTLAAQQLLPFLQKMKVPKYLYHLEEGKFSCYIDAVEGKMGPSSYCDSFYNLKNMDKSPELAMKEMQEIYNKF